MLERRRSRPPNDCPIAILQQMPALVLLERFPVPVLVVAEDGAVLFANTAFAAMLGRSREAVTSMNYEDIFTAPQSIPHLESPPACRPTRWWNCRT
jgi:PAS domain-containing protein